MKKWFIMSDIHGFYDEMQTALNSAGFDINNPDHILVCLGDIFDRGLKPLEVYKFIKSLPRDRRVLVRGNHEYLLKELVTKDYPDEHDFGNRTVDTIASCTNMPFEWDLWFPLLDRQTWIKMRNKFKKLGIIEWIFSDEWVNYFELNDFIGVHAWIPLENKSIMPMYYAPVTELSLIDDWKSVSDYEWEESTWGCPWLYAKENLVPENKKIICGHWHASDFHKYLDDNYDVKNNHLYYGYNCIALDACTVISGFCNVLVIDENMQCFDQNQKKLRCKKEGR